MLAEAMCVLNWYQGIDKSWNHILAHCYGPIKFQNIQINSPS